MAQQNKILELITGFSVEHVFLLGPLFLFVLLGPFWILVGALLVLVGALLISVDPKRFVIIGTLFSARPLLSY